MFGRKKQAQTKTPATEPKVAPPEIEFEARLAQDEHRKVTTLAWITAGSLLIAMISTASVLSLLPLQRTVPFMVYVDQSGVTQVAQVIEPSIMTANEVVARHFVAKYVTTRERYLYQLLQDDVNFILATTAAPIAGEYSSQFEGPNRKDVQVGDRTEEKIRLISVVLSPSTTGRATVRFVRETWTTGSRSMQKSERFVVDMAYGWEKVDGWFDNTLQLNPLGFTVTAYRVSPEYQ